MVVLKVQGERMSGDCWTLQRGGVFHFPPERGWPPAYPPNGIRLPEQDDTGGYLVWHGTSVQNGLRVMQDGRMRVLPDAPDNWPQGIYATKSPTEGYNKGCIVGLRIAGVIGSKAASKNVSQMTDMCPLGFIAVLRRSVEDHHHHHHHHHYHYIIISL